MEAQEIEFSYCLGEFGWSDVRFLEENGEMCIRATHVFNNPLAELLDSVTNLLKGMKEVEFLWFDEPGTYKIEIGIDLDQHHLIHISIAEHDSFGEWNEYDKTISEKVICVKLQHLCASVYGEMVKLNELMKMKSYSLNRNSEYPYSQINEFIKEYERKYS